jgi:hypothetical protein
MVQILNDEFDEKITFKDFSFSYLRYFPQVHIEVTELNVHSENKQILNAGDIDILLNFKGLWTKKIIIENTLITDVNFYIRIDSLGNKTQLFGGKKKKSERTKKHSFLIESGNIQITNARLHSINDVKKNRMTILIGQAHIDLSNNNDLLVLKTRAEGNLDTLVANEALLFSNQSFRLEDAVLHINSKTKEIQLQQGEIYANDLKITPKLHLQPQGDGNLIDLHFITEGNFDNILKLIELRKKTKITQLNPNANLLISFNQTGFINPFEKPYSEIDFNISDAKLAGDILPYPLEIKALKGNYNNGAQHSNESTSVVIDTLHAKIENSFLYGSLSVKNFGDPIADINIKSKVDLSHLVKPTQKIQLSGVVNLDLIYKGKINELKKMHYSGKLGEMHFKNVNINLKEKGYKIELTRGSATLNNQLLEIPLISGKLENTTFSIKGNIHNPLLHMVNKEEDLLGNLTFNFDNLDLKKFTSQSNPKSEKQKKKSSLDVFEHIAVNLNINGKKIITKNGDFNNLLVSVSQKKNKVTINKLNLDYQKGTISAKGNANFSEHGISNINADLNGIFKELNLNIPENKKSGNKKEFALPADAQINVLLKIDKGNVGRYPLKNLSLNANLKNQKVNLNELMIDVFDGKALANGSFNLDSTGISSILMDVGLNFNHLVIDHLLEDFGGNKNKSTTKKGLNLPHIENIKLDIKTREATYRDFAFRNIHSIIEVNDKLIKIDNFHTDGPYGFADIQLTINDYSSDKISYSALANVNIDTLSIDKFLASDAAKKNKLLISENSYEKQKSDNSKSSFPHNVKFKLDIEANQVSYKNAYFNDLSIDFDLNEERADLNKFTFKFAKGTGDISAFALNTGQEFYPCYISSKFDNFDIHEILASFDNFGQDEFTPENTTGLISFKSSHHFSLNSNFKTNLDDNLWAIDLLVHDALLEDVEPIQNALFFIGHKQKSNMIIKDLEIKAFMFEDKLLFSELLMNDNIANLEIFGMYSLNDSIMDFGSKISLSDIFFRSKKERNVETREGVVPLEQDSKLMLHFFGSLSDHKIKLFNRRKMNQFEKKLAKEIKRANNAYEKKENERKQNSKP